MLLKRRTTSRMLDLLHKTLVLSCVGATVCGCALLGYKVYKYYTVVKPQNKLKHLEENKHLLSEGAEFRDSAAPHSTTEMKL